jgi:hypothetical protein
MCGIVAILLGNGQSPPDAVIRALLEGLCVPAPPPVRGRFQQR